MPCWTISYFSRSLGLSAAASDPRGTRDSDSTPPAITTSAWPVMTSMAAKLKACSPEAHIRFTLVPGTDSGNPAIKGARRPMFKPCSSTWVTHPRMTSSTNLGSIPARSTSARSAKAAKSSGLQSFKAPPRFPMGVRTAPTITASRIERIHADHVPRGIRRFSTSRLPRRDKETGFHGPHPVCGLEPKWARRDSREQGQACGDHPQGEPHVRQLLRHVPRRERGQITSISESSRRGSSAHPCRVARATDDRRPRTVRRAGHTRVLLLCEDVLPVRQLLHGCGRPVHTESPDAPLRRLSHHRQPFPADSADD